MPKPSEIGPNPPSVAIIGANGFIGTRIVEMLHLSSLAEVRPIVRTFTSLAPLSKFDLDFRIADAFNQSALRSAFENCDSVIHCVAGDPKVILGTINPTYYAAEQASIRRFIYLSTASVHGQSPAVGTDENSELNDNQPLAYNNAKVKAERSLLKLRNKGTVELVILRPGIVYGPRSYWIASFAEKLLQNDICLFNEGKGICNAIYVDNLVHAIFLAMFANGADKQAFLVGDEERITWAELYRPLAESLGFDIDSLPPGTLPKTPNNRKDRLEEIRMSKTAQGILSFLPLKLRQALYLAYAHLLETTPVDSPWELPEPQPPILTQEMAWLYQCQYKLPYDKAAKILGYKPIISFQEACRRSISWLAFAGYPVKL